jgi:hypothetical protein
MDPHRDMPPVRSSCHIVGTVVLRALRLAGATRAGWAGTCDAPERILPAGVEQLAPLAC